MTSALLTLLGGIGLFLFGMQTMTDALRELASTRTRQALAGFTRTPLSGAVTGALTTAAIQSSSATMVTTVGFVGAGLLSFPQALGIMYGASIGTTVTGWMVLLVGFKLQLSAAALPVLFAAVLVRMVADGQAARLALAAAGLSLIFLGIDFMQTGMAAFEGRMTPDSFPEATLAGRLQLVGLGVVITLITQSSSAGIAGLLVLLATGALRFEQAAALAIGMHIGTTFTALLASVGGSLAVRQTAVANVIYHVASGALALVFIDAAAAALRAGLLPDAQIALVSFHTLFNVIGTAVMLPLTMRFAAQVERAMPDTRPDPADRRLDAQLLSDSAAALDVAATVLRDATADIFATLAAQLQPANPAAPQELEAMRKRLDPVLEAAQDFLSRIRVPEDRSADLERLDALLQQLDHLRRLHYRCSQGARLRALLRERRLRWHVRLFHDVMLRHLQDDSDSDSAALDARLVRLDARLARIEARVRHATTHRAPVVQHMTAAQVFRLADGLRWLRRSLRHVERLVHYHPTATARPEPLLARPADPATDPPAAPADTG